MNKIKDIKELGYLRVATVAPELRVADVSFNLGKILDSLNSGELSDADIVLFPELAISSYSSADLFFQKRLINEVENALEKLVQNSLEKEQTFIVGAPLFSKGKTYNSAVVISNGQILGVIPKSFLCNQAEYYEERWFSSDFERVSDEINICGEDVPFGSDLIFRLDGYDSSYFGIEICEDLWSLKPPSLDQAVAGANLIFNLSASNEYLGKLKYRRELVTTQSSRTISAYVYSSCGPGESTTDTVFSGHCMISEYGRILKETPRFSFDTKFVKQDIDLNFLNLQRAMNNTFGSSFPEKDFRAVPVHISEKSRPETLRNYSRKPFVPDDISMRESVCEEILSIQSTALAKRIRHIGLSNVAIGISGGLDSTLALIVSHKAFKKLGIDNKGIHCLTMPGFGTSKRTLNNAKSLCEELGLSLKEIDIKPAVEQHFRDIGHDPDEHNITYENSQARERTQILMDYANKTGGIVIGTGDLSEIALGWATYNADQMAMYNVNSGVPKTLVRYIINWAADNLYQGRISDILKDVSDTPISPELLPPGEDGEISQKTEESIGTYELNDFFLYHFLRSGFEPKKLLYIASKTFGDTDSGDSVKRSLKLFIKRFFSNQFKRSCMPDGVKIGTVSLSPRADWRMPSDAMVDIWLNELEEE